MASSKHRIKFFLKCGLQDFPCASLAALMIDIYCDGGEKMLVDLHYDGRNERGGLVKMGLATIEKTDKRGTNYRPLHKIVLTPKGVSVSKNAVHQIEKIMTKIQTQ